VDPNPTADGQPVTPPLAPAAPPSLAGWFRQNGVQLAVVVAIAVAVCTYLHPLDVLLTVLGLSLIIFIHELGHFAAAKWCDVHVKTFSIGFGPALPFCQFKYGETTYKLAMIPLGGYVAMVGEGDAEGDTVEGEDDPDKADADPRSFKNKPVGQRMLIISAGVIMNVLLGAVCFAVTYLHGVEEVPAVLAQIEPGSAAWRAGLRSGTEVKRINGRENPWFDDIKVAVVSTGKGEKVDLEVEYKGAREELAVEPLRNEAALYPQLGVLPPDGTTLRYIRRSDVPPYRPGSPAAAATAEGGGPGFLPGDRVVGMTDPDDPARVTPLDPNWNGLPGETFDFNRRMTRLAGKPVVVEVVRKDDPTNTPVRVTVPPAFHKGVGLRMRMGKVAAVRKGSPAEKAGVQARPPDSDPSRGPGDRIVAVELPEPDGTVTRFSADRSDPKARPLDPIRLPWELVWWSDRQTANRKVRVTVLRQGEHAEYPVTLEMEWDPSFRYELPITITAATPVAVNGLGLAYHVQTVVDGVAPGSPAAAAGLQPDDKVTEIRYRATDHKGKDVTGGWDEILPHQWAFADAKLQVQYPHEFDLKVERNGQTVEVDGLAAADDPTWPVRDRGLEFWPPESRVQRADGLLQALAMGADRTARSVKMIYQNLYAMVFGRISVKTMSGPISLAQRSYLIAGQDVWHLILWMGLISINLAVVNFLPIPVLDGGHMVFLIYELVRGKPAPAGVQVGLTYLGLAMILGLMLFVIGLDIWRLFF
jgi:regulator of sigma E protease